MHVVISFFPPVTKVNVVEGEVGAEEDCWERDEIEIKGDLFSFQF